MNWLSILAMVVMALFLEKIVFALFKAVPSLWGRRLAFVGLVLGYGVLLSKTYGTSAWEIGLWEISISSNFVLGVSAAIETVNKIV